MSQRIPLFESLRSRFGRATLIGLLSGGNDRRGHQGFLQTEEELR